MRSRPVWSTACKDWEERIVNRQSLIPFDPLFPDEAEAALAVFKSLRIVDAPGQPTFGEAAEEWVFDFVRAIFGAYDFEKAERLIEEFFLLIAKKNGKSTIAAGIMLTALIRNWRYEAELLIVAPTLEIAGNSFKPAAAMVRADENLRKLLHIQDNLKQITHRKTKAVLKVVAADPNTVGGKKAAFVLIDELWLFGKQPNAGTMLEEATGGRATRREGFIIYLSTHSDEPPAGVFKEKLEMFRDIRDGIRDDPTKLAVFYEFPASMLKSKAYLDPSTWYITNPNLGISTRESYIQKKLDDNTEPGKRRETLAKWLNIEISMGLRGDRWPGADHWEKAADIELSELYQQDPWKAFDRLIERAECVTVGIDGGGLDDLFGFSLIGREPEVHEVEIEIMGQSITQKMKRWLTWSHAWAHEGILEIRKSISTTLRDFEKARELDFVGDELIDIASIVALIEIIKERGKLGGVGVDPAGLGDMVELLNEIGINTENGLLIGVPQGFALMNAIKTTERRLPRRMLLHSGGSMMPWAISNLKIEPTATAIRATKQNVGDKKIDPVMSVFDAAYVMATNPVPVKKPSYKIYAIA